MCVIKNRNNVVIAKADKVGKMHKLNIQNETCYAVTKEVWHRIMGHVCSKNMEIIGDQYDLNFQKGNDTNCITCLEGKQSQNNLNHHVVKRQVFWN